MTAVDASIPTQPEGLAPESAPDPTETFAGRLFEAAVGAVDLLAIELGLRLGLYRALEQHGPSTSAELSSAAGVAERYAREWLEQQAVADILAVDDAGAGATARRYALPSHVATVLLRETDPSFMAPVAGFFPAAGAMFDRLEQAYRGGTGISWSDYPTAIVEMQGAFNRPMFTHEVAGWFDALPDVDALLAGRSARIADVACGMGWSSQAIARRYPDVTVDGFDLDQTSIDMAGAALAGTGLEDRVRFHARDIAELAETPYDVITMFEALHDMSHPVEVLTAIRGSLAPGGALLVMDERVADEFTAPGDDWERLLYGFSLLLCLPNSLDDDGVGTGTVIRSSTVRAYAEEAGFTCEVAPIDHPMFRFYVLRAG
jgi:SAM-dependent methyltransferase